MLDLARRVGGGAVETAFDILTLLSIGFTPKKMSEAQFADFFIYVLTQKGYVVNTAYTNFTTKGYVLQIAS